MKWVSYVERMADHKLAMKADVQKVDGKRGARKTENVTGGLRKGRSGRSGRRPEKKNKIEEVGDW